MSDILQAIRDMGGEASDAPLPPDFTQGWAVHPFGSMSGVMTAHWYERRTLGTVERQQLPRATMACASLCRRVLNYETARAGLLGPGNVRRCKVCTRMAKLRSVA